MDKFSAVLLCVSGATLSFALTCNQYLPGDVPCPASYSLFPDAKDCTKFWECRDRCASNLQCPDGYLYDEAKQTCSEAATVDCGPRPCTACDGQPECGHALDCGPRPCTACDGQPECGHVLDCSDKPDGWYAHPWNCRKYWHCLGGQGQNFTCRDNLLYDPNNIWCEFPRNVDCGERPVCDDCDKNCNSAPTHPPSECKHECSQDGDFAEECCGSTFCKCWNGHGTIIPCPEGQFFNEHMDWCDWPENIPCCGQE